MKPNSVTATGSIDCSRVFAIVPAAGHSRRMGQPKLLLPWSGTSVIESVLSAWTNSTVTRVVIVSRRDDAQLHNRCREFDIDLVCPTEDPIDMRASVEAGLKHLAQNYDPISNDAWMLAPADLPRLSSSLIDNVIACHRENVSAESGGEKNRHVLAPGTAAKRGHPVLFPWTLANEVFALGTNVGINSLLKWHSVQYLNLASEIAFQDLDSPADYKKMLGNQDLESGI